MSKVLVDRELLENVCDVVDSLECASGFALGSCEELRELLAQPAEAEGVEVLARGYFHAMPEEDDYEFHDEKFITGPCDGCVPAVIVSAAALSAVTAERDVFLRQVDTLTEWYSNSLDVIRDITAALPGTQYMDPPDGGDVSVPEQVRRMAKDADRYRWLRGRLPGSAYRIAGVIYSQGGDGVDAAVDAAMAAKEG